LIPQEVIVAQCSSILAHFPQEKAKKNRRVPQEERVDHQRPWAYFDGASQNINQICGGGAILYLSDHVHFKMKMGLGPGTNNFAELMSLKLLLLFSKENNVTSIHIFGDSQTVVKWVKKSQHCHNILLLPILEEVYGLVDSFDAFFIQHVYRERNMVVDQLSKAGIHMEQGQWHIVEDLDGIIQEYYHRPFIEDQQDPYPSL
jgi:ribonuclease HI